MEHNILLRKSRCVNFKGNEKGQAMLEYAIVFPLFLFILLFIIDCAWIGFQQLTFDYVYREASWGFELNSGYVNSQYPMVDRYSSDYIKDRILEQAPILKSKNLKVINAYNEYWTETENVILPNAFGSTYSKVARRRYVRVNADIIYKLDTLTFVGDLFFGSNKTISKYICKTRLINSNDN